MSMFPDCRVDGAYNEDFLCSEDKSFILGYDFALNTILNLMQNNLDVYTEELTETLPEGETCAEDEVYASRSDLFSIVEENKVLLGSIIAHWHELSRDEIITSMIDGMDTDVYTELRKKALEMNKTKENPKEYFDSRHWTCTGEKILVTE